MKMNYKYNLLGYRGKLNGLIYYTDKRSGQTITREQIFSQNLPCKTLKDAIDAGLLPRVNGYERWQAEIYERRQLSAITCRSLRLSSTMLGCYNIRKKTNKHYLNEMNSK